MRICYCELFDANIRAEYVCARWSEAEEGKAEADVDTVPTAAMARNAQRALDLRKSMGGA